MAQIPPGTSAASILREWLLENGREFDYRTPAGTLIPLAADELEDILAGVCLSGRIMAVGHAAAKGHAKAVGEWWRRRGPPPSKRDEIMAEMEKGIAEGRYTLDQLQSWPQAALVAEFKAHHKTIEKALALLKAKAEAAP